MVKIIKLLGQNYQLHFLGMFIFGSILLKTYAGIPLGVQIFLTILSTTILGLFWEFAWKLVNKENIVDKWDVIVGVIGGLLTFILNDKQYLAYAVYAFVFFWIFKLYSVLYIPKK